MPQPGGYVDATVTAVERTECDAVEADALAGCARVEVRITSGPDAGDDGVFLIRDTDFGVPEQHVGDKVVLLDVSTSPPPYRYSYSDVQRATPMWWLLGLFVVAVIAVGRWQGVRALTGLVGSGVILVVFLVPALIRNESAVLVALVASAAIAFLALYLAHGFNPATTVALAGTLLSLALITLMALVATEVMSLSGLASQDAQSLRVTAAGARPARVARGRHRRRRARRARRRHRHPGLGGRRPQAGEPALRLGSSSTARRCGSAGTTSRRRSTPSCSPTPVRRCRWCCCSARGRGRRAGS